VAGHRATNDTKWHRIIGNDWGVNLKPVARAMNDFRTKKEAGMRLVVMRCVGWDEDGVRYWAVRPR
jgi:hypothetical protein